MPKQYGVNGPTASGTASKTGVTAIGSTSIRPMISDWTVGPETAPAGTDQNYKIAIGRTTTTGTAGSNPTPLAKDPGDVAAVGTAGITHSAEPTYGSTYFFNNFINQRGTFRWVPDNGGQLIGSATASNCIGFKLDSVTAAMVLWFSVTWQE